MSDTEFPNADQLLANNMVTATDGRPPLAVEPLRRLAVVSCMDCRIDIETVLGLEHGEAHILRNAGGVVTDDIIRSLTLSQRYLGTREVLVISHTDCGLSKVTEPQLRAELSAELGVEPDWALEGFADPADAVRRSMARLVESPFVTHTEHVRGFVYDVETRLLTEVS